MVSLPTCSHWPSRSRADASLVANPRSGAAQCRKVVDQGAVRVELGEQVCPPGERQQQSPRLQFRGRQRLAVVLQAQGRQEVEGRFGESGI